jgi:hypothetical protein
MPRGTYINLETWKSAREAIENGEGYPLVAERFGMRLTTLKRRASMERWESPARRKNGSGRVTGSARPPEIFGEHTDRYVKDSADSEISETSVAMEALAPYRKSLLLAANEGPEAFREALKRTARTALAESVADIPLPRTIGEWSQMVAVLERAEKMGGPHKGGNAIRHASALRRAAPIEAEVIPEVDGFAI